MKKEATSESLRVLVIEDDQSVRRMLRFSLRDAGFEITETPTGGEALQHLQRQVPEAIILDLGLPDGLGGAVLEWLRQKETGNDGRPAWVVMSAQDQNDVVKQYGPLGDTFWPSPLTPGIW